MQPTGIYLALFIMSCSCLNMIQDENLFFFFFFKFRPKSRWKDLKLRPAYRLLIFMSVWCGFCWLLFPLLFLLQFWFLRTVCAVFGINYVAAVKSTEGILLLFVGLLLLLLPLHLLLLLILLIVIVVIVIIVIHLPYKFHCVTGLTALRKPRQSTAQLGKVSMPLVLITVTIDFILIF